MYSLGPEFALADGSDTAWYPQRKQETRGVGTLRVHVAPPRVVVASGVETDADNDRRAGTFTFRVDAPANFTFAAAPFTVLRAPLGSPLKAYVLRDRANASAYLASCARVFAVLQDEFGPDPYGAFSVVEVPDAVAAAANFGGASSAGVILASSSFLNAPFNVAYFGHEISHQWWGNSVQVEGGSDEAMAQFGSLEVVRRLEGAASAERYRRTGYPGYVARQDARGYFEFVAAGADQPLANLDVGGAAHDIGDSKGFLVYDLLARETGRERFRRNLRRITATARSKALAVKELVYRSSAGGPSTWPGSGTSGSSARARHRSRCIGGARARRSRRRRAGVSRVRRRRPRRNHRRARRKRDAFGARRRHGHPISVRRWVRADGREA